jgi:hypothetical protein
MVMKTLLTIASLLLILAAADTTLAVTSEPNPPAGGPATSAPPMERDMPGINVIEGTLLNIEGNDYFIVDATGRELRFKVDGGTKILGEPKAGDRIKADISSAGRAALVKKVD